jgi:hypothetical protein
MAIVFDQSQYHLRVTCDGVPTPLHCDVAIESVEASRDACIAAILRFGWRLWDNCAAARCPACAKREGIK